MLTRMHRMDRMGCSQEPRICEAPALGKSAGDHAGGGGKKGGVPTGWRGWTGWEMEPQMNADERG